MSKTILEELAAALSAVATANLQAMVEGRDSPLPAETVKTVTAALQRYQKYQSQGPSYILPLLEKLAREAKPHLHQVEFDMAHQAIADVGALLERRPTSEDVKVETPVGGVWKFYDDLTKFGEKVAGTEEWDNVWAITHSPDGTELREEYVGFVLDSAYARRLAACVKACNGSPTEALEQPTRELRVAN